jgi:hypothetical protein
VGLRTGLMNYQGEHDFLAVPQNGPRTTVIPCAASRRRSSAALERLQNDYTASASSAG